MSKISENPLFLTVVLLIFIPAAVIFAYRYVYDFPVMDAVENDEAVNSKNINQDFPELILDESVIYSRTEEGAELYISYNDNELLISNNHPSLPAVSPDRSSLVYIAPHEWEKIGDLYLFDSSKESSIIMDAEDLTFQYTPKLAKWLDNRHVMVIVGYGYGTVSVGGDLFLVDSLSGEFILIYESEKKEEVKDISMEEDKVLLTVAVFDEEYLDYELKTEQIKREEILEAVENI